MFRFIYQWFAKHLIHFGLHSEALGWGCWYFWIPASPQGSWKRLKIYCRHSEYTNVLQTELALIPSHLPLNLQQMRVAICFPLCQQSSLKRNKIFLTWNILLGAELDFCYTTTDYFCPSNIWGEEIVSSRASALGEQKKNWQHGDVSRSMQGIYLSGHGQSRSSSSKACLVFFFLIRKKRWTVFN